MPAHARHTCGLPRQLMNQCTKYGAMDLFENSLVLTQSCSVSPNKSSIVCVCFGRVILENVFRNFTFEIIDNFKFRGSSRPYLNQMHEFSLNCRPLESSKNLRITLQAQLITPP